MKVKRTAHNGVEFRLGRRERQLFTTVLKLYPRMPPPGERRAGSSPSDAETSQHLLEESLSEYRAQTRQELERLIIDPARWTAHSGASILHLTEAETEMLLQVLNDVRVGSWVALGSPEERRPPLRQKSAPDLWAMEVAGYFQMAVLEGLNGSDYGDCLDT